SKPTTNTSTVVLAFILVQNNPIILLHKERTNRRIRDRNHLLIEASIGCIWPWKSYLIYCFGESGPCNKMPHKLF
ncbi:hypothetical protein VIGAN_06129900, partial [Vigna angularis var. angularis]